MARYLCEIAEGPANVYQSFPRSGPLDPERQTLADVLERVLDKGLVIAGDIKIKLVNIELLTIQIRLVVASVEKAREMGMDWWTTNPELAATRQPGPS